MTELPADQDLLKKKVMKIELSIEKFYVDKCEMIRKEITYNLNDY